MNRLIFFVLTIILLFTGCAVDAKEQKKYILYVPLDERPVNLDYAVETVKAAGENVLVPPVEYLPSKKEPGNVEKLWQWVFENCRQADYIVLSADTMMYGGLTPSRVHNIDKAVLKERAAKFNRVKELNPEVKLFVFDTIMRSHRQSSSTAEPEYYSTYGSDIFKTTSLMHKKEVKGLTEQEQQQLKSLTAAVPREIMDDYLRRRDKNFLVNSLVIDKTYAGVIDHLVLCRDDTSSYSQSSREYRLLAEKAADLPRSKFTSTAGADEIGLLLLARAVNERHGKQPAVYARYNEGVGGVTVPRYEDCQVWKNVRDHLNAAGCLPAYDPGKADLILAVNTPVDGITREAGSPQNAVQNTAAVNSFVSIIKHDINQGRKVALADIAFANGGDNSLMAALNKNGLLHRISSYAGWNTAGNSIGCALSQGILSAYMDKEDALDILAVRLLEDWGYQANVRGEIQRRILKPLQLSRSNLGTGEGRVKAETEKRLVSFAGENLKQFNIQDIDASFPWNRTFEVYLKLNRADN